MPIVQITVVAGRDEQVLKHCAKEVAHTIHRTLGAPLQTVRVLVNQVPAAHWIIGDSARDELDAQAAAKTAAVVGAQP